MQPVPLNDLRRQARLLGAQLELALRDVILSGWYILGEEVKRFEESFASFCGVDHCVAVANGTDALELALKVLGCGVGSRVVTAANAGFYSSTAILSVGGIPVYIDVDATSHLLDLRELDLELQRGTVEAVVVTHLYGLMHEMGEIVQLCSKHGVPVIEDCAQAHGAARSSGKAGSFGRIGVFSFYPTKNLGACGDAGALVTRESRLADSARALRQYGWKTKYNVMQRGGRNSRLDEVQAAVLSAKLPLLGTWNEQRRQLAARYSRGITNPLVVAPPVRGEEYVAHLYVVECEARDQLRAHLTKAGIQTDVHYPVPDHLQPVTSISPQKLPVTERLCQRILTLPLFPELLDSEVDRVVSAVNAWVPAVHVGD